MFSNERLRALSRQKRALILLTRIQRAEVMAEASHLRTRYVRAQHWGEAALTGLRMALACRLMAKSRKKDWLDRALVLAGFYQELKRFKGNGEKTKCDGDVRVT
jgi:hypothetical protein